VTETTSTDNTVTWWEIPVTDITAGKAFYQTVFGWDFQDFGDPEAYAGIVAGGVLVGGLFRAEAGAPKDPAIRIYVNVSDLEATLAAAEAAGGTVRVRRTEVGGDMGWWAEISDPDGRWLGLCTDRPAVAG
jgi:predicted enzyme related to lactoylglutathione lyase